MPRDLFGSPLYKKSGSEVQPVAVHHKKHNSAVEPAKKSDEMENVFSQMHSAPPQSQSRRRVYHTTEITSKDMTGARSSGYASSSQRSKSSRHGYDLSTKKRSDSPHSSTYKAGPKSEEALLQWQQSLEKNNKAVNDAHKELKERVS